MKGTHESGFTLIEVVIAMGVLAIGIMAMYNMQVVGMKGNSTANRITSQATWGADQIETMVELAYDDNDLSDLDGDGTGKDNNRNGIDDRDEAVGTSLNFGLGDLGPEADGSKVSPDGHYTVYWNVAEDQPIENAKTVRIIVQHNVNRKTTAMQYVKTNPL